MAHSQGVRPSEILTRLQAQFGDETLSKTQVYEWHKRFSAGRERVENEPHDQRPRTSITQENICAVRRRNPSIETMRPKIIILRRIRDDRTNGGRKRQAPSKEIPLTIINL
ncbi:hypothetical protein NQ318_005715 [Aromia moschata]|uniref:Mos1 transposase HTH domain-containing protein n=1 Tax=Aromia moschata TaxID=1265417 RepID=A0AAV8X8F8_9CUCU|nr:hypothetical protein NQ318_005715 [Aromia moschata]